jgi:hypothetical protein
MRSHVANGLGFWHTFKMAHFLVFRHFSLLFFAPAFHHITPGHQFFVKPSRLIQVQEWFTLFRLSYDGDVKQLLRAAKSDVRMNDFSKAILGEFKDLCRFFIPVVGSSNIVFVAVPRILSVLIPFSSCGVVCVED